MTQGLPSRPDVEAAAFRNGSRIRRTPVLTLASEDSGLAGNVVLKLEFLQHTGLVQGTRSLELRAVPSRRHPGRVRRIGRQPRGRRGLGSATCRV